MDVEAMSLEELLELNSRVARRLCALLDAEEAVRRG